MRCILQSIILYVWVRNEESVIGRPRHSSKGELELVIKIITVNLASVMNVLGGVEK